MQRSWLLVKTLPRREGIVASILEHRGLDVFLPRTIARSRSQADDRDRPLFPGYLFARTTDRATTFPLAHPSIGIAYVLGAEGKQSHLPDELIDAIRSGIAQHANQSQRSPSGIEIQPVSESARFSRLVGATNGFLTARGRVRVLLETVQQLVPLDPDAAQVAIAS